MEIDVSPKVGKILAVPKYAKLGLTCCDRLESCKIKVKSKKTVKGIPAKYRYSGLII